MQYTGFIFCYKLLSLQREKTMANRNFRKMLAAGSRQVAISGSFYSGAAEDGTFTDQSLLDDGYVAVPDGYNTAGILGAVRVDVGQYDVWLNDVFVQFAGGSVTPFLADDTKDATCVFGSPIMQTVTGTDQRKRSVVRINILVGGARSDLTYEEGFSFVFNLSDTGLKV